MYCRPDSANPGGEKGTTVLMIFQHEVDDTGWLMGDGMNGSSPITIGGESFRYKHSSSGDNAAQTIVLWLDPIGSNTVGNESHTFDLKAIIDDMRGRGHIQDSEYLTSIQIGWEIIEGGTFQTNDFWTAVQNEPEG